MPHDGERAAGSGVGRRGAVNQADANRTTPTELRQVADGWEKGVRDADVPAQREILRSLIA